MFFAQSAQELRNYVLAELCMGVQTNSHCTVYENSAGGFLRSYGVPGLFEFCVADYVVDHGFRVRFECPGAVLRFGIVHEGRTFVQIDGGEPSGSLPSVFVGYEEDVSGVQEWKDGQHLCGAEFSLYPHFYEPLLALQVNDGLHLDDILEPNRSYRYMPLDMASMLERVVRMEKAGELNTLLVQAAATESLGILARIGEGLAGNSFRQGLPSTESWVGEDLPSALTRDDMKLIEAAHDILERTFAHPPTIESLGMRLGINPQKLMAGFSRRYRTTIGQFTLLLRMDQASLLLRATEEPVGAIARRLGYANTSNFIKAFRRAYGCSPTAYRSGM